jgi:predicted Zn-dependent protease
LQKLPPAATDTDAEHAKTLDQAANAYQQAAAVAPDYAAPRFNLGLVRLRQDRAQDALDTFEALARANPAYPNIHLVRAEALRKLGRAADAVGALEEQVRRQPNSADGWWQLSRALSSRNLKQARLALCRAKALGHPNAATAKECR